MGRIMHSHVLSHTMLSTAPAYHDCDPSLEHQGDIEAEIVPS